MADESASLVASFAERLGKSARALFRLAARALRGASAVAGRLVRGVRARIARSSKRSRVAFGAIFGLLSLLSPALIEELRGARAVAGGVRALGLDVSRLEQSALERVLTERARELERRPLRARVAGKPVSVPPAELQFRIDLERLVWRTLAAGRSDNPFERMAGVYARWFAPHDVETPFALDARRLSERLERWEASAISDGPFAGALRVAGASVSVEPPRGGRLLERAGAERMLRAALVAPEPAEVELPIVSVAAPVPAAEAERVAEEAKRLVRAPVTLVSSDPEARVELSPQQIGTVLSTEARPPKLLLHFVPERIEEVLSEAKRTIEREPVPASFAIDAKDTIEIVPSRPGVRIDVSKIGAALTTAAGRADRSAELPLSFEPKPSLTTEEARALGIKGLVSSFTTRHPCCEKRVHNIHRIADMLDGRIVRPDERVSLNEIVGPRTKKNGFVPAPSIEDGEIVDSLGGGISQFATTFFNALFHGGYEIIERQPHTYWFPRYPMGHEATLSWPKPDVIFRNDTAAGMLIKTSYTATSITVKIYGDNGGRKVRAQVSERQNVSEPPVEILPNPRVSPDEERVKEPGSVGWSVVVSRFVTFADGVTREDRRRVTYRPRPKRIEVHPCRVPKGEKGYTGERCPEPEDVEELPESE